MPGTRELLAIVLGALMGIVAIAYPGALLSIQTAGTRPDRRNEYGEGSATTNRAKRFVQLLGVLALVISAVIAYQAF